MAAAQPRISQPLVSRYSAGPSTTRSAAVKSLHENIRSALENWGDRKFDTFLQGSYRNGTAIADINDVDIVALYDPFSSPTAHTTWEWLFGHVVDILRKTALVSGRVSLGDKCVKLEGDLKADIVPAISRTAYSTQDPVIVYSRRERSERPNYPRTHYAHGVAKQTATQDAYKPTVRLVKRWKQQYPSLHAPSFYVECALHSVPTKEFDKYLPLSFAKVALEICDYPRHKVIKSVAGDKDILMSDEWHPDDFAAFQEKLLRDAKLVIDAMNAPSQSAADRLWKAAFGE
ncbi:MAG: hypothetical protein M3417_04330 [Actinomycetota bacterium]|nr:hypothetical protein [Actinomycetota bacterium]